MPPPEPPLSVLGLLSACGRAHRRAICRGCDLRARALLTQVRAFIPQAKGSPLEDCGEAQVHDINLRILERNLQACLSMVNGKSTEKDGVALETAASLLRCCGTRQGSRSVIPEAMALEADTIAVALDTQSSAIAAASKVAALEKVVSSVAGESYMGLFTSFAGVERFDIVKDTLEAHHSAQAKEEAKMAGEGMVLKCIRGMDSTKPEDMQQGQADALRSQFEAFMKASRYSRALLPIRRAAWPRVATRARPHRRGATSKHSEEA